MFAYVGHPQNLKDLKAKPKGPKKEPKGPMRCPQYPSLPKVGVRILGLRRRELRERLAGIRHENPFYNKLVPLVWLCRETRWSPILGNIKTYWT